MSASARAESRPNSKHAAAILGDGLKRFGARFAIRPDIPRGMSSGQTAPLSGTKTTACRGSAPDARRQSGSAARVPRTGRHIFNVKPKAPAAILRATEESTSSAGYSSIT